MTPLPLPDDPRALLQRCARIATGVWSDALDRAAIPGVLSGLPHRSGSGRCAGFAMTAQAEVRDLGGFELAEFGQDRMVASAGPTQVLVVAAGGAEVSMMGGIVALSARKRGIEGVLIDGACRDIEDIRATGLWVASRHVTPRTGKRRVRLDRFGAPVEIGGLRIQAGDLVVGDETGVVVVPRARLMDVLEAAERVLGTDNRIQDAVAAGASLSDAARAG